LKDLLADEVVRLRSVSRIDNAGHEQTRATLEAFERALDRTARVLVAINRLGLEEKRETLAAADAAVVIQVIDRSLARLELSGNQWALVQIVVPEELERAARETSAVPADPLDRERTGPEWDL
jgi:hypothetical protein